MIISYRAWSGRCNLNIVQQVLSLSMDSSIAAGLTLVVWCWSLPLMIDSSKTATRVNWSTYKLQKKKHVAGRMVLNRDHVRSEDDRSEEDILIRSNKFIYSHLLVNVSYWELFFKTLFRVITFLKSDENVTVVAVLVCISDTWWTFLWIFSSVLVRHVVFTLVDVRWNDLIIVYLWICSFCLQLIVVVSRLWRLWSVSVRLHREQVMVWFEH